MISLQYSDIPLFLRAGAFFKSLSEEDLDRDIEIPLHCFCKEDRATSVQEFVTLFNTNLFWGLDTISEGVIKFCDENSFLLWSRFVSESPAEVAFAHDLRSIFTYVPGGSVPLARAIELGRTEVVEYLSRRNCFGTLPLATAAKCGRLDYVELLHQRQHPWDESVTESAAAEGQFECLQYLLENGCAWGENLLFTALHNGHHKCIEYAITKDVIWPVNIASHVAKNGNLELLQYVTRRNCVLNADATLAAAEGGHVECLQYLLEIGCDVDARACPFVCHKGFLNCLQLLHYHDAPWDDLSTTNAALNGHLDCLHFLHANGCPWTALTAESAAAQGHIACLHYAMENGCPYTDSVLWATVANSQHDISCLCSLILDYNLSFNTDGSLFMRAFTAANHQAVQWLIDIGCPFQKCSEDVAYFGVILLENNSKKSGNRNTFDEELLKCVEIAHHHNWVMICSTSPITDFIFKNFDDFELCAMEIFEYNEDIV